MWCEALNDVCSEIEFRYYVVSLGRVFVGLFVCLYFVCCFVECIVFIGVCVCVLLWGGCFNFASMVAKGENLSKTEELCLKVGGCGERAIIIVVLALFGFPHFV